MSSRGKSLSFTMEGEAVRGVAVKVNQKQNRHTPFRVQIYLPDTGRDPRTRARPIRESESSQSLIENPQRLCQAPVLLQLQPRSCLQGTAHGPSANGW